MELILTYVIAPILTAVVSYLIGRRKSTAEATKSELDNVEEMARMWRETAESYNEKFLESEGLVNEFREMMLQYKEQHAVVLSKLTALEEDYNGLTKQYTALNKKYNELLRKTK